MEGPACKFLEESLKEVMTRKQIAESQKKKALYMPAINGYSKLAFIIVGLSFFNLETVRGPWELEDCLSFLVPPFLLKSENNHFAIRSDTSTKDHVGSLVIK